MSSEADAPFDRWHKKYPKAGDKACKCGTKKNPLYESSDHGRGQRWQARYTDPMGKPRRPAFDVYQEAADHLAEVRTQIRKGTWVAPEIGAEMVSVFAKKFIARRRSRGKHETTTRNYEGHLRNHILPFAGKRVAKTLARRDSMEFVDWLLERPTINSPRTVAVIFSTWRILMNYMVDQDVPLRANICSRIELPEFRNRVSNPLTPENIAALAAAMREIAPRYEVLIWIAACAGLRKGEAFALKHTSVAWDDDLIYVQEQRQEGRAVKLKTAASYATLPVDHFLIERLLEHRERYTGPEPVCPSTQRGRKSHGFVLPPDEGLLVTNRLGAPVRHHDFWEKWRVAVARVGLPESTRYHDLKHFYTSQLNVSGHDPKTVQALSRHARFTETWDTYAHPPLAVEGVKVAQFSGLFTPSARQRTAAA